MFSPFLRLMFFERINYLFLLSIWLVNFSPTLCFESLCIFGYKMGLHVAYHQVLAVSFDWGIQSIQIQGYCHLMLTGYFIHSLMSILLYVDALYFLVYFQKGQHWLFLSVYNASFRSSCKAGLVVIKSLSTCLSIKDFIFPSIVKLSLAGYEILG